MNGFSMKTVAAGFALACVLTISPAFADVIHLRSGEKIQDATVVKVGEKDVEYKIGEREVIYTAKKSNIVIILYADGTEDIFDTKKGKREQSDSDNFTKGQRWTTFGMNVLPGFGSAVIMKDWTGAYISWGILGAGVLTSVILAGIAYSGVDSYDSYDSYSGGGMSEHEYAVLLGSVSAWVVTIIWNAYRSYSYDKPQPATASKYGDLNLAILPTRQGNGMAYGVMYNLGF